MSKRKAKKVLIESDIQIQYKSREYEDNQI